MPTPLTKEDLREALYELRGDMATKKDLKSMATKKDLEVLRSEMATKEDIRNMATKNDLEGMATKYDLKGMAMKADLTKLEDDLKLYMNASIADLPTKDDLLALEAKFIEDVDAVVGVQVKDHKDLKRRVERLEGAVFAPHA